MHYKKYPLINRDISWLSFNQRVLQEASDPKVPALERLKFLGIFSNNQDEFFRVRVASLKRMVQLQQDKTKVSANDDSKSILSKIQKTVVEQQLKFENAYQGVLKDLEKRKIFILDEKHLSHEQGSFVNNYFHKNVRPALVPIMLDKERKFPDIKENSNYLLVKMSKGKKLANPRFSLLEIPSETLSRFVVLPADKKGSYVILLDDVIRYCLKDIYQIFDFNHYEAYTIKLTRDAELDFDNDMNQSHVEKISKSIKNRKKGLPVRLVYDSSIDKDLIALGIKMLKLGKEDSLIPGGRYHNFRDFIRFPDLGHPELLYEPLPPLPCPELNGQRSVIDVLRKKDVFLTYPYQDFCHVIDLLREAAIDPKVVSIKINIYRVAKNSNIINALRNAIKNGKQVTVVVEIQARFDEEANIYWADKLQEEGAKVIFGVPGFKVHSKLFLITRREGRGIRNYVHIGTGNFNESTAKVYSDYSLLTADKNIADEVAKVFDFFENNLKVGLFKHLVLSPFNLRKKIYQLIKNEIKNAKQGLPAYIDIKLNNFCDEEMVCKIYEASQAGVKIRIIARGVCSVIPGKKGISENIEVISLVDKFLEHARLYVFANAGDELFYISSADWMGRNLDHRVEVTAPIYNIDIQKELRQLYEMQFKGNVKVRNINGPIENEYRKSGSSRPFRAQNEMYKFFQKKLNY